ncbi:MAG: hypothetical protein ACRDHE_17150 [Ktedonobacterales bacterium]
MASGTLKVLSGPAFLSNSAGTNIYQGGGGSALIYDKVIQIHFNAKLAATITMYKGLTAGVAAGTELFSSFAMTISTFYDWFGLLKLTSTDFLTGSASVASAIVCTIQGEQFVV